LSAPQGHGPVKVKCRGDRYNGFLDLGGCENCPRRSACPAVPGKEAFFISGTIAKPFVLARRGPAKGPSSFGIGMIPGGH